MTPSIEPAGGPAAAPHWSTASFGQTVDTSPMELSALGEHLDVCRHSTGKLFAIQCALQVVHRFALPRLVTLLVVLALLAGTASLVG